jgi:hypothetical protein
MSGVAVRTLTPLVEVPGVLLTGAGAAPGRLDHLVAALS